MPQALPFIVAGALIASTAATAFGQYQAGQAADAAGKYQAKVAKNNAILADRAAADAVTRGAIEESRRRAQGRMILGAERAAFAASGINLSSETAVDIQASQAGLNELDALTIRSNAAREAAGFQQEGMNYRADALALKAAGANAKQASYLAVGGTVLSGAAQVAGSWYTMNPKTTTGTTTRRVGGAGSSSGYFSG